MQRALSIALIEDHEMLREVTTNILEEAGHRVAAFAYAEDVHYLLKGERVDLFILDLNLPGEDGISLAKRIRKAQPRVGIIMATARESSEDMAAGYASGADIYMTKPVAPEALLAAIDALDRRMSSEKGDSPYQLNMESSRLSGPQGVVDLQESETRVLIGFARASSHLLEMGELALLFGMDEVEFSKGALMVRVTRLRKKLREVGGESLDIKVHRRKGYQLTQSLQMV